MAKRFTDTEKWKKKWYRELGSKLRDIRQFCLDFCDHAGILELDFETIEHYIGETVTLSDVRSAFRDEVIEFDGDKIFFPAFVEFQYGDLNPENRAHFSVISILEKKGLTRSLLGAKDKDKDKDKDKEFDFEKRLEPIYREYPKRPGTGKRPGFKALSRQLNSDQDFADCIHAASNYRMHCEANKTEPQFIKTFVVWCGSRENPRWREWIDVKINNKVPDTVER